MEKGFGTSFEEVRVHSDGEAVQMSKDLGAQAFTVGQDVFFNEGKYAPDTGEGKKLLAHELTHTVQQSGGGLIQKKQDFSPEHTDPAGFGTEVKLSHTVEDGETLDSIIKIWYADIFGPYDPCNEESLSQAGNIEMSKIKADIMAINKMRLDDLSCGQVLSMPDRSYFGKLYEEKNRSSSIKQSADSYPGYGMHYLGKFFSSGYTDRREYVVTGTEKQWAQIFAKGPNESDTSPWDLMAVPFMRTCLDKNWMTKRANAEGKWKGAPNHTYELLRAPNIHEIKSFLRALYGQQGFSNSSLDLANYWLEGSLVSTGQDLLDDFITKYQFLLLDELARNVFAVEGGTVDLGGVKTLANQGINSSETAMITSAFGTSIKGLMHFMMAKKITDDNTRDDELHYAHQLVRSAARVIGGVLDNGAEEREYNKALLDIIFDTTFSIITFEGQNIKEFWEGVKNVASPTVKSFFGSLVSQGASASEEKSMYSKKFEFLVGEYRSKRMINVDEWNVLTADFNAWLK
jgi:hypothetical protein